MGVCDRWGEGGRDIKHLGVIERKGEGKYLNLSFSSLLYGVLKPKPGSEQRPQSEASLNVSCQKTWLNARTVILIYSRVTRIQGSREESTHTGRHWPRSREAKTPQPSWDSLWKRV